MGSQGQTATRKYGEKREAILFAAAALINEVGVRATTFAEVAGAIGLNPTSITYYFSRKDELVAAVYEETLALMERMAHEAAREATPSARIRSYIAQNVDLRRRIREGERGLVTALSEIRTLDPERQAPLLAHYARVLDIIRGFFGEWRDLPQRALFSIRAHVLLEAIGWWPVWSLRYSARDFGRVEERMFDILAHGLPAAGVRTVPVNLHGDWRRKEAASNHNDEFLRAATLTINERGYRGASVNRIAELLGVTKGSFYHHHEAKDDLVLACFQASYDRLSAVQLAGLALPGSYWSRLVSVLDELVAVQFFDTMPLLRTTALQALESRQKADVVTRSNRLAQRFAGMLADGIADGSVRAIDPIIASQIVMSTLNAAYEARHWAARFADPDEAVRTYRSTLSEGLLAPS